MTERRDERRGEARAHPNEHGDLLTHALLELVDVPAGTKQRGLSSASFMINESLML